MVYGSGKSQTKLVDTKAGERACYLLTDDEVLQLARWAAAIEGALRQAMDMEWAKDGETGEALHRAGAPRDGAVPKRRPTR